MDQKFNFQKIEEKWKKIWSENAKNNSAKDFDDKPKHYHLMEFPYPSGAGLHVGHCMGYGASDAYSRMMRMQGYNVLFPIGWDAFGLPTENYAIKTGKQPRVATDENIEVFRRQMKDLGMSFDFSREVDTTDPKYFRWTQWIFLQFYKHAIVDGKLIEVADDDTTTPRLAFQAEMPVNWCPSCKIILANEEVIGGNCERCGAQTEKRKQKQWMLRITAYADRLIKDLDTVDYLQQIKTQQINWIGKSEGTEIVFKIVIPDSIGNPDNISVDPRVKPEDDSLNDIKVFTTRADTLFGVTYVVLAPEHSLVERLKGEALNTEEIDKYIDEAKKKSDMDRTELAKDKTGVELKGIKAVNPINGKEVSVWIADYVLATYGTGAVMAVPAHDDRDFEFATKYDIPIIQTIAPEVTYYKTKPKEGLEWVERVALEAIVYNPKTQKYLCLKWKNQPWTTFITGGIEEGEDPVEAAKREIHEETGYKNLKLVKELGITKSKFHAAHKNCNRSADMHGFLFELVDEEKDVTSKEEQSIHDLVWLDRKDLKLEDIVCASFNYWMAELDNKPMAFTNYGYLVNSGEFSGLDSKNAIKKITEKLKGMESGDIATSYKLRDWIFSRQHYWGEPIPIVHCEKCGVMPLPESELPLILPEVENYQPTDTGESPLAAITDWVNTKCPKCGGSAKRETDTMPNWAGSSWYFLAYAMNNDARIKNYDGKNIFNDNKKELEYWMPVDLYNGGNEHTTLHLLYSRFWNKFLFDLGVVPSSEPYAKRIAHGIILGTDGRKMSKSFGNVINPDDIIKKFGADTLRAYIMFIGPYDKESAWSMDGIMGVYRFINKLWDNFKKAKDNIKNEELEKALNKTIRGVDNDINNFLLNTYLAKLMEFNNILSKEKEIPSDILETFVKLFAPAMPFVAEELWTELGNKESVFSSNWPKYDPSLDANEKVTIVVQINGKIRDKIDVEMDLDDETLKEKVLSLPGVKTWLKGSAPKKVIVVKNKIVSIVI